MIETDISRAILEAYQRKLLNHLENDVVIVGAGPAGLTAGYYLAKAGIKTAIIERKLSTGGASGAGRPATTSSSHRTARFPTNSR